MVCKALFLNFFLISFLFGLAVGQWSNFGGNAQRQSRSNATGDPHSYYSWTLDGADLYTSPVIGIDGTLYVRLANGSVCALNSDGQYKWVSDNLGYTRNGLALLEHTLFVPASKLFALNTTNGHILWNVSIESEASTPIVDTDRIIYFASDDNLYAINGSNGSILWSYTTHGTIYGSPALGLNGRVYLIGGDGWMYSIYANNGSLDWEVSTGIASQIVIGNPAVGDDGTIFAGDHNGLFAFAPDGAILWSIQGLMVCSSPAIGWNGYIYVGGLNSYAIYCIHPQDGTILWDYSISVPVYSTATIGYDGSVYIAEYVGFFYCFYQNLTVKWDINATNIAASAAIGTDGSVYVVNYYDTLYAFLTCMLHRSMK
jgi:outer membrane protein assembly factor BamB